MNLGINASLGFRPFPKSLWNMDATNLPTDVNNVAIINAMPNTGLLLDCEVPYLVVDGRTQPWVKVKITLYPQHSDGCIQDTDGSWYCLAPFPLNYNWTQKGQNPGAQDYHAVCVDCSTWLSYECENCSFDTVTQTWSSQILRIFNLFAGDSYDQHGYGPGGMAAGCSWMAGILTYDEAIAGPVTHALGINLAPNSFPSDDKNKWYVQPASFAIGSYSPPNPNQLATVGLGTRFLLNSNFNATGLTSLQQNIIAGLKKYGLIVTMRGSSFYASATGDSRWSTVLPQLSQLRKLLLPNQFRVCDTHPRNLAGH